MFISKREYKVEVTAILSEGVDFTQDDLQPNVLVGGRLKELSSEAATRIALDCGYLACAWSGHYDDATKTVTVVMRKPLYLDEATHTYKMS